MFKLILVMVIAFFIMVKSGPIRRMPFRHQALIALILVAGLYFVLSLLTGLALVLGWFIAIVIVLVAALSLYGWVSKTERGVTGRIKRFFRAEGRNEK